MKLEARRRADCGSRSGIRHPVRRRRTARARSNGCLRRELHRIGIRSGARSSAACAALSSASRGKTERSAPASAMIDAADRPGRRGPLNAPRLLSARLSPQREGDAVVAGQRAHPASAAIEQCLAACCSQARQSVRRRCRNIRRSSRAGRHGLEQHAAVAELKGDVDQVGIIGQAHRIGAADPGGAAQPREQVAEVVQRLAWTNSPERLVDQGDVGFAEQMVRCFRTRAARSSRATTRANRRPAGCARRRSRVARGISLAISSICVHQPPGCDPWATIAA